MPVHPRTRWFLTRIPAAAVLGLLTTIAVAWSLAAFASLKGSRVEVWPVMHANTLEHLEVTTARRAGSMRRLWLPGIPGQVGASAKFHSDLASTINVNVPFPDMAWGDFPRISRTDPSMLNGIVGMEDARGWPRLALWCSIEGVRLHSIQTPLASSGGIALSRSEPDTAAYRVLPFRPIWRGLLIDWAAYAILWLVLFTGLGFSALRRALRLRRGLCPACGYDLTGNTSGVCPECGGQAPGAGRA